MIDTVVVGKNSFLARQFKEHISPQNILFLSHNEALSQPQNLEMARVLVNFAFAPALSTDAYKTSLDIDTRLAQLAGKETRYVMISSRMVYGEAVNSLAFSEEMPPSPTSCYGVNKLIVEGRLKEYVSPNNLTILRLSNVFGFEPQRKTFFGAALTNLHKYKRMRFDIAPESVRDFLPAAIFASYLDRILNEPTAGTFNIGSGLGISCLDITKWIIDGYGEGEAIFKSEERRGEFVLDTQHASKTFALLPVSKDDIRQSCIDCGRRLKTYEPEAAT